MWKPTSNDTYSPRRTWLRLSLHVDYVATTNVHSSGYPMYYHATIVAAPVNITVEPCRTSQGSSATTDFADRHIMDHRTAIPLGINSRASLPTHTLNPHAAPYLPPLFGVQRSPIGYQPPLISVTAREVILLYWRKQLRNRTTQLASRRQS